jgi:hypothetical protein
VLGSVAAIGELFKASQEPAAGSAQ